MKRVNEGSRSRELERKKDVRDVRDKQTDWEGKRDGKGEGEEERGRMQEELQRDERSEEQEYSAVCYLKALRRTAKEHSIGWRSRGSGKNKSGVNKSASGGSWMVKSARRKSGKEEFGSR